MTEAQLPDPVPSVLPAEGVDLLAELERYRMWLIEQALIRAGGDIVTAGKLLGFRHKSSLYRMLRHRQNGGSSRPGRAAHCDYAPQEPPIESPAPPPEPAPAAAAELAPALACPEPPPPAPAPLSPAPLSEAERAEQRLERIYRRIPWDYVEQLRAKGWAEWRIARNLATSMSANRLLIERALGRRRQQETEAAPRESAP